MSYTPSLTSSHKQESDYVHPGESTDAYAAAEPSPIPVEPVTGVWKYVPFQYMSLKPKISNPYVTTAIACMGGLLFGFGSTNLTPFIGHKAYEEYFSTSKHKGFTAIQQSGMTASMPGGALIGSCISALVSEKVGRRGMVELSALVWIIGCAIQTASINRPSLAFGRIIASIGVGTASSNVPMYLAEMVPANMRGRFVSCFQLCVNIGILVMFYIGFGCSFIHGIKSFRITWGLQMIPGFLMLMGAMFLHESPRWLASKGRWEETAQVLTAIYKCDPESPVIREEIEEFQRDLEVKPAKFIDLFRKQNIKQTFCAGYAMFTQQYCGTNAILYFSTSITSQVGYKGTMNQVMGSVDYIVLLAATLPALVFFDRWSRRYTLMLGALGLLTSLAIVAGIEATRGVPVGPEGVNGDPSVRWNVPEKAPAKAALAFSYIYLACFSLSWGPGAWVYVGEVFNQDVRSAGNAFASIVNWLFNFTLTIYTQTAFQKITWKTYVIFAVFSFLAIPVVFFVYPETRGFELEQISALFKSDIPAYKTDPLYILFVKRVLKREVNLPAPELEAGKKEVDAEHDEHVVTVN